MPIFLDMRGQSAKLLVAESWEHRRTTYHMNEMCEDSGCFWIPQRTCCILRLVLRQETIIQECIIASDTDLTGVFEMNTANKLELFVCHHGVLFVFAVDHFVVRLHIPVIIVFILDRGLIEYLRWTDMVVASKSAK